MISRCAWWSLISGPGTDEHPGAETEHTLLIQLEGASCQCIGASFVAVESRDHDEGLHKEKFQGLM